MRRDPLFRAGAVHVLPLQSGERVGVFEGPVEGTVDYKRYAVTCPFHGHDGKRPQSKRQSSTSKPHLECRRRRNAGAQQTARYGMNEAYVGIL